MIDLTKAIHEAHQDALEGVSRLTGEGLAVPGLSGTKLKHFLNNIAQRCGCYLEIGSLHGASLSAVCCGHPSLRAFAVENFSYGGGTPETLRSNRDRFAPHATLLLDDAFAPSVLDQLPTGDVDLFFYDGDHSETAHEAALPHFIKCFKEQFVFLCDDWNWDFVRAATLRGIERAGLTECGRLEIRTETQDGGGFWNGLGVFVFEKV